ncbi:MAG: HD domain-containing protein [Candidatus Aminicenantes bacterium]|nr:HD domain-containing protein [Candidatus Aminicenantes bacterium]
MEERKNHIDPARKALLKTAEELFVRFSSALKTAQIYAPNNLAFVKQISPLFTMLQNILNDWGQAQFHFRENTLFFNTIRVKFDFLSFHKFKLLAEIFREREIGLLGFASGLDNDEFNRFVILLANSKTNGENPFEDFKAKIESDGLNHIFLEKLHPFERAASKKPEQVKQAAKKVFIKSIVHLKDVFNKEPEEKMPRLRTSRRLIQSIVNIINQDEAFMIGLTNMKNFDDYIVYHSANVSILSVCFGRRLGLDRKELIDLGISSFFHDIGKLGVPKEIIDKKEKLNDEEKKIMQRHTYHGAGKLVCLKDVSYLPVKAIYVALEHHLWANLSGYPKYWKRDTISLFSKIVKICDFFDAITTKRPYREYVLNRDEALSLMIEKSGEEFDPVLLKIFANMVGVYPIGTLVALNTGELSIVTETNPEVAFILRPKVKLITDEIGNKIDGEIVDLTERDPETEEYKRSIIKSLEPEKYDIKPSDYFLAQEN